MSALTLPRLEVANAHFLTPRLLTGGDLHLDLPVGLDQIAELVGVGLTHVVDNRAEWTDEYVFADHAPQIRFLHNGVDDAGQQMPDEWFDRGVGFARAAWADDPDAVVLTHCHMGINRGPSLAYAILLDLGDDPIDAIALIRRQRDFAAIGYAEDALDWHLRRAGIDAAERRSQHERLAEWRSSNWIDVPRIIRQINEGDSW